MLQRATRGYGDRVVHALRDHIEVPDASPGVRRAIPGVYAAIGTQVAAEVLLGLLRRHRQELGVPIREAIGEINGRCEDLKVGEDLVTEAIDREVAVGVSDSAEGKKERVRVVVGLLALIYSREDVVRAHTGLVSGEKNRQSNALELLDNLARVEHKRVFLPFIEACIS